MTLELSSAFLLGLLGSAHCAGMCGPIALALAAGGGPSRARFVAGRCAYNAGRVLTYMLLGLPIGLFGHVLRLAGLQQALSIAAGAAIIIGGLAYLGKFAWWHSLGLAAWTSGLRRLWDRWFPRRTGWSLFGVGLLNGLLPCGLVYAALTGAAATGSAAGGARFMLAFGAGTFPMMLGLSLAGRAFSVDLRRRLQPLIPASLLLLGGLLVVRGLGLGIPYLSPSLNATDAGSAACCHVNVTR